MSSDLATIFCKNREGVYSCMTENRRMSVIKIIDLILMQTEYKEDLIHILTNLIRFLTISNIMSIHVVNQTASSSSSSSSSSSTSSSYAQTCLLTLGGTVFLGLHGAMLFSLPSVLRSRGAPYLPTFRKEVNSIFYILQAYCTSNHKSNHIHTLLVSPCRIHTAPSPYIHNTNHVQQSPPPPLFTFIDLGSGDGRLVFRAAREKLFHTCIGYEINPGSFFF